MADKKKYYWLKFRKDFFNSLRIKRLRKLAGGDTFTIIYLKMQLLSIVTEGHLKFKGIFDNFAEEIAEDINEEPENVSVTIQYLLGCGLLEQNGDDYFLPYAAENIGSECDSAERVRNYRDRQKMLQSNESVTDVKRISNTEIEIDKEKDIDKRKRNKFNRYQQSEYDFDAIEKALTKGK